MVQRSKEGVCMKKIIGVGIIIIDIIAFILLFKFVYKKGVYKGDIIELLLDSCEVIGLFIAVLLTGIVLIIID